MNDGDGEPIGCAYSEDSVTLSERGWSDMNFSNLAMSFAFNPYSHYRFTIETTVYNWDGNTQTTAYQYGDFYDAHPPEEPPVCHDLPDYPQDYTSLTTAKTK
jgi:hypothetical protein